MSLSDLAVVWMIQKKLNSYWSRQIAHLNKDESFQLFEDIDVQYIQMKLLSTERKHQCLWTIKNYISNLIINL